MRKGVDSKKKRQEGRGVEGRELEAVGREEGGDRGKEGVGDVEISAKMG